jgi:hypothetical protein
MAKIFLALSGLNCLSADICQHRLGVISTAENRAQTGFAKIGKSTVWVLSLFLKIWFWLKQCRSNLSAISTVAPK